MPRLSKIAAVLLMVLLATPLTASLGRGGAWRRFLRPFGRDGGVAIPRLAATLTTLGVAGLLLAALPTLPLAGVGTSMGAAESTLAARDLGQPANASPLLPAGAAIPGPLDLKETETVGGGSGDDVAGAQAGTERSPADAAPDGSPGPAPLVLLGIAFLGAGLGLLLLRQAASRLR